MLQHQYLSWLWLPFFVFSPFLVILKMENWLLMAYFIFLFYLLCILTSAHCFPYFVLKYIKYASSLQSIGFVGPGIALIGLISAKSPSIASGWLTLAVGLKSFSHSGFLVNLQVDAMNTLNFNFKLEWMFHFPLTFHSDYLLPGDRSTIFWCTAWYFYLIPHQYLICLI